MNGLHRVLMRTIYHMDRTATYIARCRDCNMCFGDHRNAAIHDNPG